MIFIDRLTNKKLKKLPNKIQSGRYTLLHEAVINNHTELKKHDVILSDGTLFCKLLNNKYKFYNADNKNEIFIEAILTIYQLRNLDNNTVSPLIPLSLFGDEIILSDLEKKIDEVIKHGHLHHISQKPRIDLKYDEAVIDISRARRLSNNTLKHLASHSECWQQRTLTGVIPRKILARFSKDDYGLYENNLYSNLINKLEIYLQIRLTRITTLNQEFENALSVNDSEDIHHILSNKIFTLWGDTFNPEQIEKQLKTSNYIKSIIENSLKMIKGLKQYGLYPLILNKTHISGHVYRTNILKHDPHYQQLPALWEMLQKTESTLKPKEIFHREYEIHQAYINYVGLIISLSLEKYKIGNSYIWLGSPLQLNKKGDEWQLHSPIGEILSLVPWSYSNELPKLDLPLNRMICWPGLEEKNQLDSYSSTRSAIPISPLDLYVVERMGIFLDEWLIRQLLSLYGRAISPIPNELLNKLSFFPEFIKSNSNKSLAIHKPIDNEEHIIDIIEKSEANKQTKEDIIQLLNVVREISCCPICRSKNNNFTAENNGFSSQCYDCQAEWYFDGKKYRYSMNIDDSFKKIGRNYLELFF